MSLHAALLYILASATIFFCYRRLRRAHADPPLDIYTILKQAPRADSDDLGYKQPPLIAESIWVALGQELACAADACPPFAAAQDTLVLTLKLPHTAKLIRRYPLLKVRAAEVMRNVLEAVLLRFGGIRGHAHFDHWTVLLAAGASGYLYGGNTQKLLAEATAFASVAFHRELSDFPDEVIHGCRNVMVRGSLSVWPTARLASRALLYSAYSGMVAALAYGLETNVSGSEVRQLARESAAQRWRWLQKRRLRPPTGYWSYGVTLCAARVVYVAVDPRTQKEVEVERAGVREEESLLFDEGSIISPEKEKV